MIANDHLATAIELSKSTKRDSSNYGRTLIS